MDGPNIIAQLRINEVKHEELLVVLLGHFGRLSSHQTPGEYVFEKRDNLGIKLTLGLNKNGKITAATHKNITDNEFNEIKEKITNCLIENQKEKVAQTALFCRNLKVDGYFRYKDMFQILPAPPEAPEIDQVVGDHPFLLQYKYISSLDSSVDAARRKDKETELSRRLSFFTRGRIIHAPYYTTYAWVYEKEFVNNDIVSRFAQMGCHWKGQQALQDSFTNIDNLKSINLVDHQKYYNSRQIYDQEENSLLLPDTISTTLEKIGVLPDMERTKFDLACNWYYLSHQIWLESRSSSFIASVTALECLFDKPEKCPTCGNAIGIGIERCDECSQPMFKINKTLKDFLTKYVPSVEQWEKELRLIYKVRSHLAHGLSMLNRDIEPGLYLKPIQQEEDNLQRNIQYLVFIAIYNWLLSK